MTKEERDALAQKSAQLDNLQNLVQKGTYPGIAARQVLEAQQFILSEWNAVQAEIVAENKRIEDLLTAKTEGAKHEQQSAA